MVGRTAPQAVFDPRLSVIEHDPVQWANLYEILMPKTPSRQTLFILHENGRVVKSWPGFMKGRIPQDVADPTATARFLHDELHVNVCVIELSAWNEWLERLQRSFDPSDDILLLLLRAKEGLVAGSREGIVMYPDPFAVLAGIGLRSPSRLLHQLVPAAGRTSLVLGVLCDAGIHASLCLEIVDASIRTVTTCPDDGAYISGNLASLGSRMMEFTARRFCPPALGAFCSTETATRLKAAAWKREAAIREVAAGSLVFLPRVPAGLTSR